MPLSAPVLASLILAQIQSDLGITDPHITANYTQLANAIATAVVAHIQSMALVNVVTTCPAGAGSGVGTVS